MDVAVHGRSPFCVCEPNRMWLFYPKVERLKNSLAESEDSRFKLVERAKRHVSV